MILDGNSTAQVVRGHASEDFTLNVSSKPVVVSSGGTTQSTVEDRIISTYSTARYKSGYEIVISCLNGFFPVDLVSLDENVATIDPTTGVVSYVADGIARILARSSNSRRRYDASMSYVWGGSTSRVLGFVAGSLMRHCSDGVDALLVGKTPSTSKPMYSTLSNPTFVRNTGCFGSSLDLTGVSAWNSLDGYKRAGTAIARDIILIANHFRMATGTVVKFVTSDNTVVSRTIVGGARIGSTQQDDLYIHRLDSDLPSSICHYKVLPADTMDHLPSVSYQLYGCPALCVDQQKKLTVAALRCMGTMAGFWAPVNPTRLSFYEEPVSGDSGCSSFLLINGSLCVVTVWFGVNAGTAVSNNIDAINSAMTALGSEHQLDVVDLSGFPTY